MTWTDQTWAQFCALLDDGWPGDLTPDQANAYRVLLDLADPAEVVGALRRLLYQGHRFRPSAAELLGELRRDASEPTFDEAYRLIFGPGGVLRSRRSVDVHPLVTAFIERQGEPRLRALPLDDPEWGHRHRRDLAAAWDRHVTACRDRDVAALAAGRRGDLARFDPLRVLHGPDQAQIGQGS